MSVEAQLNNIVANETVEKETMYLPRKLISEWTIAVFERNTFNVLYVELKGMRP